MLSQVKNRLAAAVRDGRFMQAVEFAKSVYKAEPIESNRDALFDAYLGRGRQVRGEGKTRDALTALQNAVDLGVRDPARLGALSEELAACGEVRQALALLEGLPESTVRAQVLARAADVAVQQETKGRALLPEDMRADFDRVLQAFKQLESGQDDGVRETLQGVGLRSPFLEWKLLLRGLQAYDQRDDGRAIENWQRLTAERLPARLAAPLRARIDAAYRLAQPPAAQTALQQQADRLGGQGLAPQLRAIQTALSGDGRFSQAFRMAENILPSLHEQAPDLVPRLASCFYWAVITGGAPEDVPRYLRVFGPPGDDPECHRLQALACERYHNGPEAHGHWQNYEKFLATNPHGWTEDQARRARALIWLHMGRNAARVPDLDRLRESPAFLGNLPGRPKPLKPSADKCYQNSIKLAPDLLEAHDALIEYHRERKEFKKAERAARHLLARCPNHGPTQETLSDLLMEEGRYQEALACLQQAARGRLLDRGLREKMIAAHTHSARTHAEAGRFEQARADYRAALDLGKDGGSSVLCKWAACEFKAGDAPRAEELLGQALRQAGNRLAVVFSMVIESIRLKLPRPLKNRFDKEFNEALAEPPTGAGAAAVLQTAASHHAAGVKYVGQKTHEKRALAYVERARSAAFTEDELGKVCNSLLVLKSIRPLRAFCRLGAQRFPRAAIFPYLEAESYFVHGVERAAYDAWQAKPLLETAHRLASEMPPDDRRGRLLEAIQQCQKLVQMLSAGPFGLFDQILDQMGDFNGDDDDDWDDGPW